MDRVRTHDSQDRRQVQSCVHQTHFNMEGRDIVRVSDVSEIQARPILPLLNYRKSPAFFPQRRPSATLFMHGA